MNPDPNKNTTGQMGRSVRSGRAFEHLDNYTDGDPDFRQVLIPLIIENLLELQRSLHWAREQKDPTVFYKSCHKAQTTIEMVDSKEFILAVEALTNDVAEPNNVARFDKCVSDLIEGLTKEIL